MLMNKPSPFRSVVTASTHCNKKFGMTVVMFACFVSFGIQGTNLPLDASVVEGSLNGGPRSL